MRWLPTPHTVPDRTGIQLHLDGVTIKNEFGVYLQRDLGSFDIWFPTRDEQENFTGEITLFTDGEMLGFTFLDGKLVKKDWGFLSG